MNPGRGPIGGIGTNKVWTESAKMVTAVHGGQNHRLKSPFLTKKDDPGVPSI